MWGRRDMNQRRKVSKPNEESPCEQLELSSGMFPLQNLGKVISEVSHKRPNRLGHHLSVYVHKHLLAIEWALQHWNHSSDRPKRLFYMECYQKALNSIPAPSKLTWFRYRWVSDIIQGHSKPRGLWQPKSMSLPGMVSSCHINPPPWPFTFHSSIFFFHFPLPSSSSAKLFSTSVN